MFAATVVGNVGKDAELRYLADGKPVLGFSIATNHKSKDGEETTWVNVSFFGVRAEKIAGYVTKGKTVSVYGTVRNRPYEKDGQQRYSLDLNAQDIQLLGGKDGSTSSTESDTAGYSAKTNATISAESDPF